MKFAIPAAALTLLLLCLRTLSAWRRLTALRKDADEALKSFHTQQLGRINALAALMNLTNEHVPGALRVRSDVAQACFILISSDSSLKDIGKRERTMYQILTEISQAAQMHPVMRSDVRYFKYMNDMSHYESLSNTNRLLYNASANKLNRELQWFPVSGHLLGFQKQEYIEGPQDWKKLLSETDRPDPEA